MMKAVIIEDEQNSREVLRAAVDNYTTGISIIGEADNVSAAVALVDATNPDLIFLDIELSDGKGFDVLDRITAKHYHVIFVTAYDDYAIKAIRYSAFDYLVKPLDIDDLENAIKRINQLPITTRANIDFLQAQLAKNTSQNDKIMVPSHNGYQMIDLDRIVSIEADDNHVFFVLETGNKHVAAHSLTYYEDLLPAEKFYRIHKSHIVNFTKVTNVEVGRTGKAILNNGKKLDIAARRKASFMSFLKKYTSVI